MSGYSRISLKMVFTSYHFTGLEVQGLCIYWNECLSCLLFYSSSFVGKEKNCAFS